VVREHFLKSTDDLASQALARILAGKMNTLDAVRKSGWARFLMTLRFRHPDLLAEARAGIALLWKHHDMFTTSWRISSKSMLFMARCPAA
jgi:hypothetical protein